MRSLSLPAPGRVQFQTSPQQPLRLANAPPCNSIRILKCYRRFSNAQHVANGNNKPTQQKPVCQSSTADPGASAAASRSAADTFTSSYRQSSVRLFNPIKVIFGKPWRKAVPLSVLFFSATYIFTMLQSLKDGIVVVEMGPEALPFLTTFGSLPASLAYFGFYRNVLVPNCPPKHLFYATALPFLAFYTFFALVLYPLAPSLQNPSWLTWLPGVLPQGLHGLAAAVQHWVYSLFYVVGDLWGPVMITMAFWTVADEVCTMSEAAAVYPQLGLLANLGLVGSGGFIKAVHAAVGGNMGAVLKVLVCAMWVMTCVMFACKALINRRYIKPDSIAPTQTASSRPGSPKQQSSSSSSNTAGSSSRNSRSKPKQKASWDQVKSVLASNPKALELTTWVVSFGVAFRLCEYCFKAQLRSTAADSAAYCCALADVNSYIGAATIAMMLSSKWIFKRIGWSGAALISPTVLLTLGTTFFASCMLAQAAAAAPTAAAAAGGASGLIQAVQQMVTAAGGSNAVATLSGVALAAGAATNVAAAACRHSLFTPSKEMVYKTIPPAEVKESKAVVDLVGGQVAKSGAGWIVQLLLLTCGSISAALPAMAALYLVANIAWLQSTLRMCKDMKQYEKQQTLAAKAAAREQQERERQQWQQLQGQLLRQQLVLWEGGWKLWRHQQQQLWQQWQLPLPGELALAAAAVYGSDASSNNGTARDLSGSGIDRGSAAAADGAVTHQQQQQQQQEQPDSTAQPVSVQPAMLHDSVYWDAIYTALSADAGLLESVLLGRKATAVHSQQQQQLIDGAVAPATTPAAVSIANVGGKVAVAGQNAQQSVADAASPTIVIAPQSLLGSGFSLRQGVPDMKGVALAKEALHTLFES